MKRSSKPAARALAGALAFLMAFALAAPPAVAAEVEAEAQSPTESQSFDSPTAEKPTLVAMAEARVQSDDPAEAVAPAQTQETGSDRSFIKTPQGIAAVVLIAVATALVFKKREDDRTTSPVR